MEALYLSVRSICVDLKPYRHLVETDWLAENLSDPDLRVIDCTSLLPNYFEDSAGDGLILESGRDLYAAGHIPGAPYEHILNDPSGNPRGQLT